MGPKRRESSDRNRTTARTPKRPLRPRPTPRWLTGREDLDRVAQRRCLMLLSVLSGEKPVTAVIDELGISRGTYYQLETKALLAMLAALAPGAEGATTPEAAGAAHRIADLEAKVARLEQEKRRVERLLYLTRKVVPAGPLTTGPGRPRRMSSAAGRTLSKGAGRRPSRSSPPPTMKAPSPTSPTPAPVSTPTPAGATTP